MTGLAALVAFAVLAVVAGKVHAVRRRRRDPDRRLALVSPGARSLASNVGTLSDFRMELRLPRRR